MKNRIIALTLVAFLYCLTVSGQSAPKKSNPVGSWKFEAPYAPEGYQSGMIEVGFTDKQYSTSMMFTGNEFKLPGEKVKFENDSLFFNIYVEGQDISVSLKLESPTKMVGKAVYSEGEVPLTLTKEVKEPKK